MQKPLSKEETVLIMSDLIRTISKKPAGRVRDTNSEDIKIKYYTLAISSCESLLKVL